MSNTICRSCRAVARSQTTASSTFQYSLRRARFPTAIQRDIGCTRRQLHQGHSRWQDRAPAVGEVSAEKVTSETFNKIASSVGGNSMTMPYQAYGSTLAMYKVASGAADYKISKEDRKNGTITMTAEGEEVGTGSSVWHTDFGLLPTFSTWSQVTMLHMYLIIVRFRCLDKDAWLAWQSSLVNHFFTDVEDRMIEVHDLQHRVARSRYLKDLFETWRGVILAYDEGLVKGDAVLASAVWRNMYKAREDVDPRQLAALVGWIRMTLKSLDSMLDQQVLYNGDMVFDLSPKSMFKLVDQPSPEMKGIPLS